MSKMLPRNVARMSAEEFEDAPSWLLIPACLEALGIEQTRLAELLNVDITTVRRWCYDPLLHRETARNCDPVVRRVLFWMLQPGRPDGWPQPKRPGWPLEFKPTKPGEVVDKNEMDPLAGEGEV